MLLNVLYASLLIAVSPMVLYRMIRHGRYRRGITQKLFGLSSADASRARDSKPQCIWIHAVSVGEVNLLPSLVKRLEAQEPDRAIVVSTSTDTGYDVAVDLFGSDRVFFCPLDFTWSVQRTLRNLAPEKLILTELELWPHLIGSAKRSGCQVQVINARMSSRSANRYQKFGYLTRQIFTQFDGVGCQDAAARDRFLACGVPKVKTVLTGSIKFDNAPQSRETPGVQELAQWAAVDPWHRVWIVGSTQAGEEAMAIEVYKELVKQHPELRLVVVPRHVERFESVAQEIQNHDLQVHRRSTDASLHRSGWQADAIILVDTIGELRHWWGVGQIATVGGSFGDRGGQNMLEPAGYGSAVSFGPNTRNFEKIASELITAGASVRVADRAALQVFVQRCLIDIPAADSLGRNARKVVAVHRGATDRTLQMLTGGMFVRGTKSGTQDVAMDTSNRRAA